MFKKEEEELDAVTTVVDAHPRPRLSPSPSPSREVVVDATELNVTTVLTSVGE